MNSKMQGLLKSLYDGGSSGAKVVNKLCFPLAVVGYNDIVLTRLVLPYIRFLIDEYT